MKVFYLAFISIFLVSCSTASTVEINSNANNSATAAVNRANEEIEDQPDTNKYVIQNMAVTKRNVRNWGAKRASEKDAVPIEGTPMAYPAPDDSEITSVMNNKVPTEVRTFKNNPTLVKMERIFVGDAKNPQVKVYLRDGRVVSVPPGKISNPATVSANEILSAASVAPKRAAQNVEEKKETKETKEQ